MYSRNCSSFLLVLMLIFSGSMHAQQVTVVEDWKDFGPIPKTWKQVGNVQGHWDQADFISTEKGLGILVNPPKPKNGPHLVSDFEHGDIELEFEFMVPKGSNSGVYLQGRYEIQILDSWAKEVVNSGDAGGIYQRFNTETRRTYEGKAPRTNVSKAPGLWQHFRIVFEAPRFNAHGEKVKNAKFVQVFQNGVLIHENVEVTGPTTSAMFEDEKPLGPIMIQGDHGPVAVRNLKYKLYGNPAPEITGLTYRYFKGKFQSLGEFQDSGPTETGELAKINWDLGHGIWDFAYEYNGSLQILEAGNYTFSLSAFGNTSLYLDGKVLIEDAVQFPTEAPRSATVHLEKGAVPIKLIFYKNNYPGRRPQLGLFVEGPGIKSSPLHSPNSYAQHVIQKPFYVDAKEEPVVLRGFLNHHDRKRTHTVGVGDPSGAHFAYDLQLGAPLSVWRGEFLDTSPMWRQRGESQLMVPTGALVELAGGPTIAKLESPQSVWPDSLSSDLLRIQGYVLNRDRRPNFKYVFDEVAVEDRFEPEMGGKLLTRILTYKNLGQSPDFWARILAGGSIEAVGEGLYRVDNGRYYLKLSNPEMPGMTIRETAAGQELMVPLSTSTESQTIQYSLIY
ncbi:family 16 glycoside hydrolase [Lunatimonas salinarum]|uniref:family 16 glycoside hydrolase n=1 Tax=Lunatimonas salinarum TaxID=1774590 RepID=UPI001AE0E66A|nr:family 16 glycoside hydrolase [Lunatimonas salinarum]